MIQLGDFRLDLINDGLFELRPESFVHSSSVGVPDNAPLPAGGNKGGARIRRRVRVAFNSLLIRGRDHTIVIDPGTGDKPHIQQVRDYRMEWPRKFFPTLSELGVSAEDVDTVILTHLHWDHCGGATSLDANGKPVPTFHRAKHFVQRREVEAARAAIESGDDSFLVEDFEPLIESHRLDMLDGNQEILPGVAVEWTGGHSPGHQIVKLNGGSARAIYLSDLVPTIAQIPFDSIMSYDSNVDELLSAKERVLMAAAEHGDLLLFVHAPRQRAAYLRRQPDGEFQLEHVQL